jgi:hypothetical protein
VLQGDLIFEESHVIMITLEAMNHHEEMDADKTSLDRSWVLFVSFSDFGFTYLIGALNFLDEDRICVNAVALLKNDRADFR